MTETPRPGEPERGDASVPAMQPDGAPEPSPSEAPALHGATDAETVIAEQEIAKAEAEGKTPEWWEDPRMPWSGEPTKADKRCWIAFLLLGVYGLVMIPLRPTILALDPHALAVVSGSSIAMVDIGAGLRLGGESLWWMWLMIAALSLIKFNWIFWWAGKLWGHGMIEVIAGRSRWAARTARYAEMLARRFGALATFLVVLIPFLPSAVVFVLVGGAGMKLRTFLLIDYVASLINRGFYLYLGYRLGQPAKDVVDVIQKYATWITIVLVVMIVIKSVRDSRRQARAA